MEGVFHCTYKPKGYKDCVEINDGVENIWNLEE